jgi:hypothetical protein
MCADLSDGVRYRLLESFSMGLKKIATICCYAVLACMCLPVPGTSAAQIPEPALMRACEAQVSAKFRRWRPAPVSPDMAQFAKSRNLSPTRVSADFNGDGQKDVAFLFLDGAGLHPGNPGNLDGLHIAVCMTAAAGARLYLINHPYCGDGIAVSLRGGRYYDFERNAEGNYKVDGVHAYCFEKAGATYQFENGSFHQIVDSD